MGLDMYLSAVRSFYPEWIKGENDDSSSKEEGKEIKGIRRVLPEMFRTGNLDYVRVEFEAGYWRKANQIHKWFVDNVQEGNDDCKDYPVSREDLEKLLDACEKVKEDNKRASELLPVVGGFFFGSAVYDRYYFEQVGETIKIIKRCLGLPLDWSFKYEASW